MFVTNAKGRYFRNYNFFSLDFTTPLNVFIGKNGQGKSSFLEAICCAFRGRSFYPFVSSEFIQREQKQARVCLQIDESGLSSSIEACFSLEKVLKKDIFYCGKKTVPSFLSRKFPTFVFTEERLKCIRHGFEQRRIFVDEMLHNKALKNKFNMILRQKQSVLKNIKSGLLSIKEACNTLEILNDRFLQLSFHLVRERLLVLDNLFLTVSKIKSQFFTSPLPCLDFAYFINKEKVLKDYDILDILKLDIDRCFDLELKSGLVLSGPQKHAIYFLFNGKDSKTFCSKGEQRLYVLSLLGSLVHNSSYGFLFLDDALMELDQKIQDKFIQFLSKNCCQSFLTHCNIISLKTEEMSLFSVKNASIKRL